MRLWRKKWKTGQSFEDYLFTTQPPYAHFDPKNDFLNYLKKIYSDQPDFIHKIPKLEKWIDVIAPRTITGLVEEGYLIPGKREGLYQFTDKGREVKEAGGLFPHYLTKRKSNRKERIEFFTKIISPILTLIGIGLTSFSVYIAYKSMQLNQAKKESPVTNVTIQIDSTLLRKAVVDVLKSSDSIKIK